MVKSTQIARLDGEVVEVRFYLPSERRLTTATTPGLMLAASVDDEQVSTITSGLMTKYRLTESLKVETELAEVKSQAKMIFRRLNRNSEQQASIASGQYTLQ